MRHTEEYIALAVVFAFCSVIVAVGWYVNKGRPARLARLREAPTISVESVSGVRVFVALLAGAVVAGGSAPPLMVAFPEAPLMILVSIGLAFAAVIAPLTFARRFTIDVRLVLESRALRFEQRGAHPVVVDLALPFTMEAKQVDDEVLVLVEQGATRVLFAYRQGLAFVTLPLSPLPEGWVGKNERVASFGEVAAIIHERLRPSGRVS